MPKSKVRRKASTAPRMLVSLQAKEVSKRWLQAIRLSESGKALQAIKELEEVIRLQPKLPGPHYDLALIHDRLGAFSKAIENYEDELQINPRHADASHNLGCIYASQRQFEKAQKLFRRTLEINPHHADAAANLDRLQLAASASSTTGPGPSGPATISLCLIAKNEEANLPGCLESVKGLVDEMVVADTGSTDSTVAIAESYGARVFHLPWKNDFAVARNESLKHATSDWLLILDADERLDPENAAKVRDLVENARYSAYFLELRSKEGVRENGNVLSHLYARLFRRLEGVHFEGAIHEQIFPSLYRQGIEVGYCDIFIEHLGYARDEVQMRAKGERNLAILEKQVEEFPDSCFVHFNLGKTYMVLERYDDALCELRKCLTLPTPGYHILANAHCSIGGILFTQGDVAGAMKSCHEALSYGEDIMGPHILLANAFFKQEKFSEAAMEFGKALSVHQRRDRTKLKLDNDIDPAATKVSMGVCFLKAERYEDTVRAVQEGIDEGAGDANAYRYLAEAHFAIGEFEKALVCYTECADREETAQKKAVALMNRGTVFARLGRLKEASESFRGALGKDQHLQGAKEGLISALMQMGDYQQAKSQILQTLTGYKGDLPLLRTLEQACVASGDYARLTLAYQKELELGESESAISCRLGRVLDSMGDREGARDSLLRAVKIDPSLPDAWHELGMWHAKARDFKEAEVCLKRALELSPEWADALNSLGIVQVGLGDRQQARSLFERALAVNPSSGAATKNIRALEALDLVTAR